MLYYGRIDISEGINFKKTNASKECNIYHCWYFLNTGFKFQPNVCNGFHYLLMMPMNLSDIYILNIKNTDYSCIINRISKSEAIKLLQNIDLIENNGTL